MNTSKKIHITVNGKEDPNIQDIPTTPENLAVNRGDTVVYAHNEKHFFYKVRDKFYIYEGHQFDLRLFGIDTEPYTPTPDIQKLLK